MSKLREIRGWSLPDFALLLIMLGATGWIGRAALADIWARGSRGGESAYILFAPIAAIYLVWLRRSRLQYVRFRPSLWGPFIVILGLAMTSWGFDRDVMIAWQGGVLVSMVGCVVSMTGPEIIRQFAPAFFVFFLLLPVPGGIREKLAVPLQGLATNLTAMIIGLLNVEYLQLGNQLVVNGSPIAIGETCNGMPMILALGFVVFVFVFSLPLRNSARVILLLISPFIALLCNVIRLVPTSLMYGLNDMAAAELVYSWSAWVMIPVAILMLLGVLKLLHWLDIPVTTWRLVTA